MSLLRIQSNNTPTDQHGDICRKYMRALEAQLVAAEKMADLTAALAQRDAVIAQLLGTVSFLRRRVAALKTEAAMATAIEDESKARFVVPTTTLQTKKGNSRENNAMHGIKVPAGFRDIAIGSASSVNVGGTASRQSYPASSARSSTDRARSKTVPELLLKRIRRDRLVKKAIHSGHVVETVKGPLPEIWVDLSLDDIGLDLTPKSQVVDLTAEPGSRSDAFPPIGNQPVPPISRESSIKYRDVIQEPMPSFES
ncbi:hypothetical protein BC830DRAFT_387184 [Chytriomyces sp. MP71]|nr:hypothetical protein BC830DRAFT_387184 [Chytriomyces sp. MP71]